MQIKQKHEYPSFGMAQHSEEVEYPSFSTAAQPTSYLECMKSSIQATGATVLGVLAKVEQERAQEAFKQDVAKLIRKKQFRWPA